MSTRDYSNIQEKYIARITGGEVQCNSGGTRFGGGDVHTSKFFIEAKTKTKASESFSIKEEWIKKMWEQAFSQGKEEAVLAIRFDPDINTDYYLLNEKQFLEYLEWRENN